MLDLEYVQLNVPKVLALFNKVSLSLLSISKMLMNLHSYSQNGDEIVLEMERRIARSKRSWDSYRNIIWDTLSCRYP